MATEQEKIENNVIVYDVCNLDSTISAALLQEQKDWISVSVDAIDFPFNIDFIYHWVGVMPTEEQRQKLFGAKNIVYGLSPMVDKFFDGMFTLANITVEDDAFKPHKSILQVIDQVLGEYPGKNAGVVWNVASAIEKFMICDKRMELNAIATLWYNYEKAVDSLTLFAAETNVMVDHVSEDIEEKFLEFLKVVKKRLSRAWCISSVQIGKQFFDMPVLNLETDITPWAIKLSAIAHDRVMAFHTYGKKMHATVFSRCDDYHNFKSSTQNALEQVNVSFWY